jgi:signal transduction histidine kinase
MDPSKTQIVRDIESARAHLERALNDLLQLPVRPNAAADLATRTLDSYVVLARGTVDLLSEELREYPVRDVHVWLDGLVRATDLMEQLVEQIRSGTIARQELKWEEVEIATLLRRLCHILEDMAARRGVGIDFDAAVSTSRAWTDRIVAASLFQQILANALSRSPRNSTIKVHVEELQDRIISRIRDCGSALSTSEHQSLEEKEGVEDSGPGRFSLNLSRRSVEQLGGKLWCESDSGEGLCVCVSLPKPGNSKE